ncbi:MAG: HAD family phosphatase [Clostridia bacterium]|nr:HAD family phosphatase [Clostridia bacterium]
MKIKAAIFDMDGTLVDSLMLWDVIWSTFGEKYLNNKEFRPSADDDKAVRTLTLKDAMELIHKNYNLGDSGLELLDLANNILLDFYFNRVELKEGVREFLEFCKNNGVKMCIASATAPELVKVAIKRCDIEKYFLKVFSCSDLGLGKDKPDIYLLASEFLGEEIKDTWVFEDSVVAIETATKIGMSTVAIYDRFNIGQEIMKEIATVYVAKGENILKVIGE